MGNCLRVGKADDETRIQGTLLRSDYPNAAIKDSMVPQASGTTYYPNSSFDTSRKAKSIRTKSHVPSVYKKPHTIVSQGSIPVGETVSVTTTPYHDAPEGCIMVSDAQLVDSLGGIKGLELWRAESANFGLVIAKVLEPSIGAQASVGSLNQPSNDLQASAEEIFENELKMLCLLQGSKQNNSYRSKSPMKGGNLGDVYKYQHDNIIGFVGYMESAVRLGGGGLERRLVLEYYTDTLRDHIEHRTQFGKKEMKHYEASLYAFQLAKGLLAIHGQKIVHRDLNPENVVMGMGLLDREYKEWLIYVAEAETKKTLEAYASIARGQGNGTHANGMTPDQLRQLKSRRQQQNIHYYKFLNTQPLVAKIANFSVARNLEHSRATTRVGNMQFMAPEMMTGAPCDFSCDVWSFGAILYEMISGKPPFYKKNAGFIETRVTNGRFPRADPIGTKGFDGLQVIMRNCLKTEPELRCSAKTLVEDLGKL